MKAVGQVFKIVATSVVIIVLTITGVLGYVVRSPMPQVAGSLRAEGLQNNVTIYRDQWGIPQIYAESTHDLFFAQGYVHAQDRFWQMEFWRRIGSGRLSEVFGETTLGTDQFARTVGWPRAAAADEALLDNDSKQVLQWYADGVNSYLKENDNPGLEFAFMGLQGVEIKPEPWTIRNSLTWLKVMAWDLGGNMDDEIERATLIGLLGPEAALEVKPVYPDDHPEIIPSPAFGLTAPQTLAAVNGIKDLTGGGFEDIGSNNWVISGSRTDTGKPYLANDPHLGIQMPSIWYEIGLHCRKITDYCQYDVTGFSFAGAPGVIIGHNSHIGWGVTNLGPDVQDLYIEKINPDNPSQYEANGSWQDAQTIPELIIVRGKVEPDPERPDREIVSYDEGADLTTIRINVRLTRHGPIVEDVYTSATDFGAHINGVPLPTPAALALKWTAVNEPSATFAAVLAINRAQNWDEFRNALRYWSVPSQNFVYADIEGNIGYQSPGLIPIRKNGDGTVPVPGWTDDYEWTGYIPFEQLPSSFNPPQGYILTANNAVVGPDYPYLITRDWDQGYRAERIETMILAKNKLTIDDLKAMQGDNANLSAQEVLPFLTSLTFDNPKLQNGINFLTQWDFQQGMDSGPAALYNLFWARLVSNALWDEIDGKTDWKFGGGPQSMLAMRGLLPQPNNHWWDNVATTDKVETRDDILRQSFQQAYDDAEDLMGTDITSWRWGKLHTATFRNQTLGESGIGLVEAIFNRGPVAVSGGSANVNNTGSRVVADDNGVLDLITSFQVTGLPSMRMILDFSNFANSQTINTTGQSGHPFNAHYNDMIELWRNIQYHEMLWGKDMIAGATRVTLTLTP